MDAGDVVLALTFDWMEKYSLFQIYFYTYIDKGSQITANRQVSLTSLRISEPRDIQFHQMTAVIAVTNLKTSIAGVRGRAHDDSESHPGPGATSTIAG